LRSKRKENEEKASIALYAEFPPPLWRELVEQDY